LRRQLDINDIIMSLEPSGYFMYYHVQIMYFCKDLRTNSDFSLYSIKGLQLRGLFTARYELKLCKYFRLILVKKAVSWFRRLVAGM